MQQNYIEGVLDLRYAVSHLIGHTGQTIVLALILHCMHNKRIMTLQTICVISFLRYMKKNTRVSFTDEPSVTFVNKHAIRLHVSHICKVANDSQMAHNVLVNV